MTTYEIDGGYVRFITEGYAGFKQYSPWFSYRTLNKALEPFTFCSIDTCDPVFGPILSIMGEIEEESCKISDLLDWAPLGSMAKQDAAMYHTYEGVKRCIEQNGIDCSKYEEAKNHE